MNAAASAAVEQEGGPTKKGNPHRSPMANLLRSLSKDPNTTYAAEDARNAVTRAMGWAEIHKSE